MKCCGRALKFKKPSDNCPLKEAILFHVFCTKLGVSFQNEIGVCVCVRYLFIYFCGVIKAMLSSVVAAS